MEKKKWQLGVRLLIERFQKLETRGKPLLSHCFKQWLNKVYSTFVFKPWREKVHSLLYWPAQTTVSACFKSFRCDDSV